MKKVIFIFVFLLPIFFFGQDLSITGTIVDLESDNEPLELAQIRVKETGIKVLTNEKGEFQIKNLDKGIYTLVYSFVGYETKEVKVNLQSKHNLDPLSLKATSISLDDLMMLTASSQ